MYVNNLYMKVIVEIKRGGWKNFKNGSKGAKGGKFDHSMILRVASFFPRIDSIIF